MGADVIAIDIMPEGVAAATAACEGVGARSFRGIVSDSNPIPLPDATASAIICLEVMEHVEDPAQFLKELVRVGKPGARYALSVPSSVSEGVMKIVAPPSYFEPPGHLRIFQREQFEALIRSAGLEIVESRGVGFYWMLWWAFELATEAGRSPDSELPPTPILEAWQKAWTALGKGKHGERLKEYLDDVLPKSYLVIASKPVTVPKPHFDLSGRADQRNEPIDQVDASSSHSPS